MNGRGPRGVEVVPLVALLCLGRGMSDSKSPSNKDHRKSGRVMWKKKEWRGRGNVEVRRPRVMEQGSRLCVGRKNRVKMVWFVFSLRDRSSFFSLILVTIITTKRKVFHRNPIK